MGVRGVGETKSCFGHNVRLFIIRDAATCPYLCFHSHSAHENRHELIILIKQATEHS